MFNNFRATAIEVGLYAGAGAAITEVTAAALYVVSFIPFVPYISTPGVSFSTAVAGAIGGLSTKILSKYTNG